MFTCPRLINLAIPAIVIALRQQPVQAHILCQPLNEIGLCIDRAGFIIRPQHKRATNHAGHGNCKPCIGINSLLRQGARVQPTRIAKLSPLSD